MVESALLIIRDDPRRSPRPAEAVRLAAGVAPWKKVKFTLYLHGPAVLALSSQVDLLVDEENYRRYLPLLAEHQQRICVEEGQPLLAQLEEPTIPFVPIRPDELARLAATSDTVLRF
jgi:hypothetical protein